LASCSFAVDNKCCRTPTGKDEAAAVIEVLRAMVKAFVSAMIKKFSRQIIQQLQVRSRPFQNLKDVI